MRYRLPVKTSFSSGHKKKAGRKPGSVNKLPLTIKEAILKALELAGSDDKGKDGLVGYMYLIATENRELMVRLIEKILPTQLTGENGGAIKILTLPPEALATLSETELVVMEGALAKLGAPGGQSPTSTASEEAYASTLSVVPARRRLQIN